jgi:hypothetical protein
VGFDEYEAIVGKWSKSDESMGGWDRDYGDYAVLVYEDPDFRVWQEKEGYLHCAVRNFSLPVWKRLRKWTSEYGKDKDLLAPHYWDLGEKHLRFLTLLDFEFEKLAMRDREPVSIFRRKAHG